MDFVMDCVADFVVDRVVDCVVDYVGSCVVDCCGLCCGLSCGLLWLYGGFSGCDSDGVILLVLWIVPSIRYWRGEMLCAWNDLDIPRISCVTVILVSVYACHCVSVFGLCTCHQKCPLKSSN